MKRDYSKVEVKNRAREYAGAIIENLEFPHNWFDDILEEDWNIVTEEFEKIAKTLYKKAGR